MKLAQGILLAMTTALSAQGAVTKAAFGTAPDGKPVEIYTLKSEAVEARIMTYGAIVVSVKTADKEGKIADVVLGYDDLAGYIGDGKTYFGAIVGRYGNRIAKGKFSLDGKEYTLPLNNGANSLHGGTVGFDKHVWTAKEVPMGVEMTLVSKDGDQGYPGTLAAHVTYTLRGNTLKIAYAATTDKDTVVNLTNHSYFNLSGGSDLILGEEIMVNAAKYTPVDSGLIPTGELAPVAGTPFDFEKMTVIGSRIDQPNEQLKLGGGYDHNWVLNGVNNEEKLAAKVHDPKSGRVLTVMTTQPGVQFYTGNSINGPLHGKGGATYVKNSGLCLETQHFPDSPNHPKFPTTELKAGKTMQSVTTFTFFVQK